jgi:hypothetical protein
MVVNTLDLVGKENSIKNLPVVALMIKIAFFAKKN